MNDSPEFLLLETACPRPGALFLSSSLLSALLVLATVPVRPMGATPRPRTELVSETVLPCIKLWLPTTPARPNPRRDAAPLPGPDTSAEESRLLPVPNPTVEAATRTDSPAVEPQKSQPSLSPLPSSDVLSSPLKPAPAALGSLPLPQLIEREAALAAGLAALPPARRSALPRLSIRVDADWLEALPQTKEEIYFSVTTPQEDSEVLAYSLAGRSFILKHPQQPLWQVREGERVPTLAALRSAAARQLGVSPELVRIYTWHPPILENALRMFVLARMENLGVQLGPSDVVTVRFASGPDGCLMTLEPIRASASQ